MAPARGVDRHELVLKIGWRHPGAEHEAQALRFWDGDGAVRCLAARALEDTTALLLERCDPGAQLGRSLREREQDEVLAGLADPAFDAVQHMLNCDQRLTADPEGLAERIAGLLEVDPVRVRLWLFARCAQESVHDLTMRELARRLAP